MKLKSLLIASLLSLPCMAQQPGLIIEHLSETHSLVRVQEAKKYLLLPIEEKAPEATVKVLKDTKPDQSFTVRLAINKIDYFVPFELDAYKENCVILDIHNIADRAQTRTAQTDVCWNEIKLTDEFDTTNREAYRPRYHFTPLYGWMNDPNGMVYKDGEWHLFYQYNPYASVWGNMNWGHAVTKDLVHWEHLPVAIAPDGLGTIFSGSCVVDKENTAGFGKNAIIAIYTSAGASQMQSLAYSTDNGRTFHKYAGNPILTSDVVDFRDPNMFWNERIQKWNLILAAGQEMRIYSSPNLKDWKEESRFGLGYGAHGGVWECPDLFELPVEGTSEKKWVLVCNLNPGGPFGGSATQYFVGDFDGYKFTCESKPSTCKWMDYGKDHYATVSFSNAPDNRRVVLAWMSNWEYATAVPTQQYRSSNSVPRDLTLYMKDGEHYLTVKPSPEMASVRGIATKKKVGNLSGSKLLKNALAGKDDAAELTLSFEPSTAKVFGVELSNDHGEKVVLTYDLAKLQVSMDRMQSGQSNFSASFAAVTSAPIEKQDVYQLRLFLDRCSLEAFDSEGHFVMTNLLFPNEPYQHVRVFSQNGKTKVGAVTIYEIK